MAKSALHYCNNCGRRIQPHQSKLAIKVRYSLDYYHETWEGCYESTRESDSVKAMTELETELVKITPIY
jgi:hypothetical protein